MAKTDTIFETFTTQDAIVWEGWSSPSVDIVDGQLNCQYLNSGPFLQTTADYDLTDSSVFVEVYHVPSNSDETYFAFGDDGSPVFGGDQIVMVVNTTTLFLRELVAGTPDDATVPYDDTTMRWWRIREAAGDVFWETSPDGADWTVQRTKAAGFTPSAGRVKLGGFNPVADQPEQPARFDNVNGGTPPAVEGVLTLTLPAFTGAFTAGLTVTGVLNLLLPKFRASLRGGVESALIVESITGIGVAPLPVTGLARTSKVAHGPGLARVVAGPDLSHTVDGPGA